MRAFVLCTGRCGSLTLARALGHASNYTVGHESRAHVTVGRLDYPDQHIEADNRLSWFLGGLGRRFPAAVWVHLTRDPEQVAASYAERFHVRAGIMPAFASGVLRRGPARPSERLELARLYVDTVAANLEAFLATQDPKRVVRMAIEQPHEPFDELWYLLGAEGNRQAAHAELDKRHNARRQQ